MVMMKIVRIRNTHSYNTIITFYRSLVLLCNVDDSSEMTIPIFVKCYLEYEIINHRVVHQVLPFKYTPCKFKRYFVHYELRYL